MEDEEEDVRSYWITFRKREGTVNYKQYHYVALCGEMDFVRHCEMHDPCLIRKQRQEADNLSLVLGRRICHVHCKHNLLSESVRIHPRI
jgi:hypothetical protein